MRKFLLIPGLIGLSISAQAQISSTGVPFSFSDTSCIPQINVQTITLPFVDNDSLMNVDSVLQVSDSSFIFRFGIALEVNKGMYDAGTWEVLPDSSRLWRFHLKSVGAYSNYLVFDNFFIPKGAKLFAYNVDKTQILGAFNEMNNKPYNGFSLGPIAGESVILEYNEPLDIDTSANIHIATFIHDFKQNWSHVVFPNTGNPTLNTSNPCNINAICEPDWCDQRRSVALVVSLTPQPGHLATIGSGALITNEKRDLTPYFLTAFHLLDSDSSGVIDPAEIIELQNWLFIFNYQSADCNTIPTDTPTTTFSISGATLIANDCNRSDFALLRLSNRPPGEYNTYLSGFNNANNRPQNGACISHPRGDRKKIALYVKKGTRNNLSDTICGTSRDWKIKWDAGSAESGSSGGPLYNEDKLIVGQVHGSKKGNKDICKRAWFGRFDQSWDNGLEPPLSPSGVLVAMDGDEPCRINWSFTNASDLHTSAAVSFFGPLFPGSRTYNGVYEATNSIVAGGNVNIVPSTNVEFDAGTVVHLLPGFHAQLGSTFRAHIDGCVRGCGTGVGKTGNEEKEPYIVLNTDKKTTEPEDENTDLNENYDFKVYPNPNTGRFTIEFDINEDVPTELYVYNLLGKIVWRQENLMGNRKVIDISSQPKGIYFIRVQQDENTYTQKLIHQ